MVDGSDITKDYATKMECIATVRDGRTGAYKLGYHTLGISALTPDKKKPKPMQLSLFTDVGFVWR
ncbi:MAG: hypothetical protein PUD92_04385 [Clostridiales bacterium]|nr:hypothetical protein [Clostridiales bacterium]